MTKDDLKAARKICEKVTPGPWDEVDDGICAGRDSQSLIIAWPHDVESHDSQFIAAARTLLPKALDALEEASREIARWREIAYHLDSGAFLLQCQTCGKQFSSASSKALKCSLVCHKEMQESNERFSLEQLKK